MIALVGGGVTGLGLAHQLAARGVEHVVLEAEERPGGVVRSGRIDGHLLEWGPQRTRLTAAMAELTAQLGIADEIITAPPGLPLYVYRAGRLRQVPFSAGDFLRTDLFTPAAKLRVLLEPFTSGARPDESVGGYFERKVGRQAYESLLGPLYGGLYASDPADMVVGLSLGHALREFGIERSLLRPLLKRRGRLSPPPAVSFREGMQTLPLALGRADRENVRLATPVLRIRRAGSGYALETGAGAIEAERVVVTTPARAAAALLRDVAPEAAARVEMLHYNPLAVVHVRAETGLRGLGYQVSLAEPLWTRGVTFNDSLFGRTGVYTIYLGGAKTPQVATTPDDELAERALREFREVTGADAEVLSVAHERMPAWDRSWQALQGLQLPAGLHLAANWESRPGLPGRLAQARRLAERLAREGSAR